MIGCDDRIHTQILDIQLTSCGKSNRGGICIQTFFLYEGENIVNIHYAIMLIIP